MEKLLEILQDVCPDVDFVNGKDLVTKGELKSFDVISIIGELNDAFDISIGAGDISQENFNSAEAIWELVKSLGG